MQSPTALETKSFDDWRTVVDDLKSAFEHYKETNDRTLAEVRQRGAADPLDAEKLARIDRTLDELKGRLDAHAIRAARPQLSTAAHVGDRHHAAARSPADLARKTAFDGYVRRGDASGLQQLEAKALSVGTAGDGGHLVPPETEAAVNAQLKAISPIRAIAGIRQVSSAVYKKPFAVTGFGTGWVGETAARPQTSTPTIDALTFPAMELYAMPAATPALLDDAAVDIDAWIAEEVRDAFAQQEGNAFVVGNGVDKPKGFLDYPKVANASWTWGNVGVVNTGAAGAFPASNPTDRLIDLAFSVRSGYRANAAFVMNRATQAAIRKFKDADGNYIWQPAPRPGESPTLIGYPVVEAEDMPDIAADAHAIAFGDFRRGYLVVDRVGIRVLRDPYSAKPYVLFYTTKRVGGGIQDFAAIKLLKFAA